MPLQEVTRRHVFVDESGDPSLEVDKEGVSDYFVLTAVLVEGLELADTTGAAWAIIRKYFPSGEMRSRTVGHNTARRMAILQDLATLNIRHYSQVIDKSGVFGDSGLRFKKSFLKFVHRTVYQNLARAFSDLHVVADEHGRSDFMLEFARYLHDRLPERLFETSTFQFANSATNSLIQVADMICGSISRAYAGKDPIETLAPIRRVTILIDEWPPRLPSVVSTAGSEEASKYDHMVRAQALRAADSFIDERSESSDPQTQAEVAVVRFLLYHFRAADPEEYVHTARIHSHLASKGFDMSERLCRQAIGRLRDHGVFIASSSRGIKIPFAVRDLWDFAHQVDSKVTPYLKRLRITRDHFLMASGGDLDIVSETEHPALFALLKKLGA